jgi:GINS complex subunit 3
MASSSYYDINEILTDSQVRDAIIAANWYSNQNQKLPCNFEITIPGMGYLEGNAGKDVLLTNCSPLRLTDHGAKLKQGTKLELPLWLGEMLAAR